jgi:hypothetical protein
MLAPYNCMAFIIDLLKIVFDYRYINCHTANSSGSSDTRNALFSNLHRRASKSKISPCDFQNINVG